MVVPRSFMAIVDNCGSDVPCARNPSILLSYQIRSHTDAEQHGLMYDCILHQLGLLAVDMVFDTHGRKAEVSSTAGRIFIE